MKFFVSTPIYYPNDIPHVGSSYTSFIADVMARTKRLLGYDVKFVTGTDENSQKIVLKAQELGISVQDFLDDISSQHKQMWTDLDITFTDFIRTTQDDHREFVQKILQKTYEKGDIYKGMYHGLYCVGCEEFKKESDLIPASGKYEGIPVGTFVCPDHPNKAIEQIQEENRFFRLSAYSDRLKQLFIDNPSFVRPGYRFNEVKAYLESGLEDFSISRQNASIGIPLPFDPSHMTYVWYDALLNYLTVCQSDMSYASHMVHTIGKNIAKFHVLYRPAMLMAADLPVPQFEIVNGFLTVDGQKISKSLGNAINPIDVVHQTDRDALVMNLFYDLKIGSDGDFSQSRLQDVYTTMLMGGRGNLVSRVSTLAAKNNITQTDCPSDLITRYTDGMDDNIFVSLRTAGRNQSIIESLIDQGDHQLYLTHRYQRIQRANELMQHTQPRLLLKSPETHQQGIDVLQFLLYVIKNLGIISAPFLINGFTRVQEILGNAQLSSLSTTQTTSTTAAVFDQKDMSVQLTPGVLYQQKQSA